MSVFNNVVSVGARRKVVKEAEALSRSQPGDIAAIESLLEAVGELFSDDFGVPCNVTITCDKHALAAKLEAMGDSNVTA